MFQIRTVTRSSTFLKSYCQNAMIKAKSRPGIGDVECFLSLDPTGMYVGELDGKPIGHVCLFKYEDGYRHIGAYYVEERYRACGYGSYMVSEVFKKSAPIKNLSGTALPHMVKKYEQSTGGKMRWSIETYDFNLTEAINVLRESDIKPLVDIKSLREIKKIDLHKYDRYVFGYNRQQFLEKWLNLRGTFARFAVNEAGSIVGYVAARVASVQDEGFRIGPLFSENSKVAQALLKEVLQEIRLSGVSSSQSVLIDSPVGKNPEAKKILNRLRGRCVESSVFMTNHGLPRAHYDNWFAITSHQTG